MQAQSMSPNQIRSAGLAALIKSLGPTGMARFIQQYDMGTGDYTKDRSNYVNREPYIFPGRFSRFNLLVS